MIMYRDIWKAFDVPVLAGVTLSVEEGELFALFGPSGTGKSVLLKTTLGLIEPDRGDVCVGGQSVFFGGPTALQHARDMVGYVFQNAALFDSLTVLDNVLMGIPELELRRLPRKEAAVRAWEALDLVNWTPRRCSVSSRRSCPGG
jgi:phospholipid/cholesterol/gamma-HCH transport system ATP-binding protein